MYKIASLRSHIGDAPRILTRCLYRSFDASYLYYSLDLATHLHCLRQFRCIRIWTMCTIKLASLEEFHLPFLGDFWTYCWRLLSDCSVLAVWSTLNQQPIHSHLPRQKGSCKQISPTFVTYPTSFLNVVFPLFYWILNYATWSIWQDSNLRNSACKADALVTRLHKSMKKWRFSQYRPMRLVSMQSLTYQQ